MVTDDIDVFIGIDVGKSDHWATALTRDGKMTRLRTSLLFPYRRFFERLCPSQEHPAPHLKKDTDRPHQLTNKTADSRKYCCQTNQPCRIHAFAKYNRCYCSNIGRIT